MQQPRKLFKIDNHDEYSILTPNEQYDTTKSEDIYMTITHASDNYTVPDYDH